MMSEEGRGQAREGLQGRLARSRTGPQQYTTPLCLLFSASSILRFMADSVSDLELLVEVTSLTALLVISDFSIMDLEVVLFVMVRACADLLIVLPVVVLQFEPGSASESSRLWLSSELEYWTARLSEVTQLGVGELGAWLAEHTAGSAVTVASGFTFCITTVVVTVLDCATLEREDGVGVSVSWLTGVVATEVKVSSEPGVKETGVGGGAGAFLFLCWLSKPRLI